MRVDQSRNDSPAARVKVLPGVDLVATVAYIGDLAATDGDSGVLDHPLWRRNNFSGSKCRCRPVGPSLATATIKRSRTGRWFDSPVMRDVVLFLLSSSVVSVVSSPPSIRWPRPSRIPSRDVVKTRAGKCTATRWSVTPSARSALTHDDVSPVLY